MNSRDRIRAAIAGKPVDRVPVALWRHFPGDDQRAESLAAAHVTFQKEYQWDLLKVTPASGYYGDRPIKKPADWGRLKSLDVTGGVYGRELHALRLIREALPDVLIVSTVFSPLTIAGTLSGPEASLRYLRENPDELHRGLELITDVTARFAAETLAAGADGIFFATAAATTDYLGVEEYEEFGRPYDLRVLEAAGGGELRILHTHGMHVMFDLVTDYPVDAINWHDRRTPPTLAEARHRFSGCLVGGINEWETLASGTPEQIAAEVRDATTQTGGVRHIVGAGCTLPIDITEDRLRAA